MNNCACRFPPESNSGSSFFLCSPSVDCLARFCLGSLRDLVVRSARSGQSRKARDQTLPTLDGLFSSLPVFLCWVSTPQPSLETSCKPWLSRSSLLSLWVCSRRSLFAPSACLVIGSGEARSCT